MTTPSQRIGQRIGAPPSTERTRNASRALRWIPATGQAAALAQMATSRGVARADLIREIATWGLTRTIPAVKAQGRVPAAPDATTPAAEKSVTWVPLPDQELRLDAQAARAGIKRNELLRRHAAAWLDEQGA